MQQQQQPRVTRIITVQGLAAITAGTTQATGLRVAWPLTGRVLWAMGSVSGAANNDAYIAGMSGLGFRIQMDGISEFVSNGDGGSFVQFATVFPSAGFRLPMSVSVRKTSAWFVLFRNTGAANFTPDFCFGLQEE